MVKPTVIDKIDTTPFKEVDIKEAFSTLKPRKKKSVSDEEDIVSVTFIPKQVKPKEVIEQEFSIKAQTYEEEEISMTGNVKLHRKSVIEEPIKTLTISEIKEIEFQPEELNEQNSHDEYVHPYNTSESILKPVEETLDEVLTDRS